MGEPVVSIAYEARPEFEKERAYRPFLDRIYAERGCAVERVNGRANRNYDLLLDGVPTEEKRTPHGRCEVAFEILQDVAGLATAKWDAYSPTAVVPLTAIGNQFITKALQQIWYVETDEGTAVGVWWVDSCKLLAHYLTADNFKTYKTYTVTTGFGLTICARIPLLPLRNIGIADQWWAPQGSLF